MISKIIAWGAGSFFQQYHEILDEEIAYVVDKDKKKQGQKIYGKDVFSPDVLKSECEKKCLIVVFCAEYRSVFRDIGGYGDFTAIDIITYLLVKDLEANPKYMYKADPGELILSVACPEALWQINGCNKFIKEQDRLIRAGRYSHIIIAPIPVWEKDTEGEFVVAVIYNGNFEGFYRLEDFVKLRRRFKGVLIQNLFREEEILHPLLKRIVITGRILYYLHDYYIICKNRFLCVENEFCLDGRKKLRCAECRFKEAKGSHNCFWDGLFQKYNILLIAPSETVKGIVSQVYNKEAIVVLPHQKYITELCISKRNKRKRIAFAGLAIALKGWHEFSRIVEALSSLYDFYCLGSCSEDRKIDQVIYINVGGRSEKPVTMKQALVENSIDMAYLGSLCPETYSYTYYECFEAGVFVITNKKSGNIAEAVLKNKNGMVFESTAQTIEWLSQAEAVDTVLSMSRARIKDLQINDRFLDFL